MVFTVVFDCTGQIYQTGTDLLMLLINHLVLVTLSLLTILFLQCILDARKNIKNDLQKK